MTTAFVASLLPARFLVQHARSLNINRIVVLNRIHEQSFTYVASELPGVRVQRLRGGAVAAALSLFSILLAARIRRRRVVYFHECCWPLFDILISILKPEGLFFPQVTMAGFERIGYADLPQPEGWKARLQRLVLRATGDRFVVYRTPRDSSVHGYAYCFAYREYPDTISVAPIAAQSSNAEPTPWEVSGRPVEGRKPQVILITGTEPVPDNDLRKIYLALIDIATGEGYKVFVKDHPITQLRVPCETCTHFDPSLPIELVKDRFDFAIGVASTGLFAVGDRKLSILTLLDAMPDNARRMRRKHLIALPGGERIEFVAGLEEVRELLRQHRRAMADASR